MSRGFNATLVSGILYIFYFNRWTLAEGVDQVIDERFGFGVTLYQSLACGACIGCNPVRSIHLFNAIRFVAIFYSEHVSPTLRHYTYVVLRKMIHCKQTKLTFFVTGSAGSMIAFETVDRATTGFRNQEDEARRRIHQTSGRRITKCR